MVSARQLDSEGTPKGKGFPVVLWLVGIGVMFGLFWWIYSDQGGDEVWKPIRFVRVEGDLQYLDAEKMRLALIPPASRSYFFLDFGEIEGAAKSLAWVDQVRVRRIWPDTLVVAVNEHKPAARWGAKELLNQRGARFSPARLEPFAKLPMMEGPAGAEALLLDTGKALNATLAPRGLTVVWLGVNKRRAWVARLNNGLEVFFGTQDPKKALDWFVALLPDMAPDTLDRMLRIDLRYRNGFAVIWRGNTGDKARVVSGKGGLAIKMKNYSRKPAFRESISYG